IPESVKKQRLQEIIALQGKLSLEHNQKDVGKVFKVLVEGPSKKSAEMLKGRNSQNKMIVFPKQDGVEAGSYVWVKVASATSATLIGQITQV
ncbi:MAG TPA: TRAM domain-containing protein, partial [Saprospiraceae bacterium]|nr:TRAM domain-containing protein [Saprospiraceae bacterium]